jgi:hypothetical protein
MRAPILSSNGYYNAIVSHHLSFNENFAFVNGSQKLR